MASIIQIRRDLAANWTSVNPVLADGEFGFEKDTGSLKIGNGTDDWNTLPYRSSPTQVPWGNVIGNINDQADLQTSFAAKADLVSGKVPSSQLPSYVDDVIEGTYIDSTTFQVDGVAITLESGKIYIDTATNNEYRWSGSALIQIVASPGSTDAVPEGSSNFYFTAARVLATLLSGLSVVTGGDIISTDSVLIAFGKIQKRFNDLLTNFNGANQLVKLDSAAKLPAIDGSQLTNLPSSGGGIPYVVASGTNTYTAAPSPALTAYFAGLAVSVKSSANTGASTLNLSSLGAKAIQINGVAVKAGDIQAGVNIYVYDGVAFQLQRTVLPNGALKVYTTDSSGVAQTTYGFTDLYLPAIDDSAGRKTNAQMNTAYPTAVEGNRVRGANGTYEYFGLFGWVYYSFTII